MPAASCYAPPRALYFALYPALYSLPCPALPCSTAPAPALDPSPRPCVARRASLATRRYVARSTARRTSGKMRNVTRRGRGCVLISPLSPFARNFLSSPLPQPCFHLCSHVSHFPFVFHSFSFFYFFLRRVVHRGTRFLSFFIRIQSPIQGFDPRYRGISRNKKRTCEITRLIASTLD